MSATRSNHQLRDRVHAQLTDLLDEGQFAAVPTEVQDYLNDHLIEQVAHEYRAQRVDAPTHGRAAIITAGVPGAGKSFHLNAIGVADYRNIDPDEIKDMLLARLEEAGLLNVRHNHLLADDSPVSPGELARWVHAASTDAADRVRTASLLMRENFVMQGTLSWHELPTSHVDELARSDYERLTILDIEVPLSTAIEQSKVRWWDGRRSETAKYNVQLGGRFISEAAIGDHFVGPGTVSKCAANARALYGNANGAGIESEILVVSRSAAGAEYGARLAPDGDVQPMPSTPLGAVCVNCGAMLTTAAEIRTGHGRTCTAT